MRNSSFHPYISLSFSLVFSFSLNNADTQTQVVRAWKSPLSVSFVHLTVWPCSPEAQCQQLVCWGERWICEARYPIWPESDSETTVLYGCGTFRIIKHKTAYIDSLEIGADVTLWADFSVLRCQPPLHSFRFQNWIWWNTRSYRLGILLCLTNLQSKLGKDIPYQRHRIDYIW